jgi:DNA-binding transcriptional ArsR family regulator
MMTGSVKRAFIALGDPSRQQIIELLSGQSLAVGALADRLPISRPAVSQHLKVLREAGLVSEFSQGTRRIYRLDPRGLGLMRDWLDRHWSDALDAFKAFADQQS